MWLHAWRRQRSERFLRLLHDGVDAIHDVPASRWNADACFDADPEAPQDVLETRRISMRSINSTLSFSALPRERPSHGSAAANTAGSGVAALENAGFHLPGFRFAHGHFHRSRSHDYLELVSKLDPSQIDAHYTTGNILPPSPAASLKTRPARTPARRGYGVLVVFGGPAPWRPEPPPPRMRLRAGRRRGLDAVAGCDGPLMPDEGALAKGTLRGVRCIR